MVFQVYSPRWQIKAYDFGNCRDLGAKRLGASPAGSIPKHEFHMKRRELIRKLWIVVSLLVVLSMVVWSIGVPLSGL